MDINKIYITLRVFNYDYLRASHAIYLLSINFKNKLKEAVENRKNRIEFLSIELETEEEKKILYPFYWHSSLL